MIRVELTPDEMDLLIGALDSHMYWQVGEPYQRNNGYVFWDETDENAEELEEAEALRDKLQEVWNNASRESDPSVAPVQHDQGGD